MKTFQKPIPILSLFAMLLLFVWACRKEKLEFDLSDKDPCGCASEVSADFDIYQKLFLYNQQQFIDIKTDTMFHGAATFKVKDSEVSSHLWYIGSEILNSSNFSRTFGSQWMGHSIPITLVVTKSPNLVCFPLDNGYDSITKYLHISTFPIDDADIDGTTNVQFGSIEGNYRMIAPHLHDSIELNVNVVKRHSEGFLQVDFINLDGLGTTCNQEIARFIDVYSYRFIQFGYSSGTDLVNSCRNWRGTISNPMQGPAKIILENHTALPTSLIPETQIVFLGRKLN